MKRKANLHRFSLKVMVLALSAALAIINAAHADTLTVIGRLALPYCTNVRVQGHVCYVTDSYGLEAVDVTDPHNPALLGHLALPDTAQHVILRDSIAYVSDGDSGLAIVNAARPESLTLLSRWRQYDGFAYEATLFQDTAYLAYGVSFEGRYPPYHGGLMKILISDPRNPGFAGYFADAYTDTFQPFAFRHVIYTSVGYSNAGGYCVAAYVHEGDYIGSFEYGDIEPGSYGSGRIVFDSVGAGTYQMSLHYPFAYVTYFRAIPGHGYNFSIIRFSSPGVADTISNHDLGGNSRGVWAESARVFVTLDSTVKLLDVSDITNPTVLAACSLDNIANGLQFQDPYVYVANGPYLTILYHTPTGVEEQVGSRQKAEGSLKANPNPFITYATVPGHEKERFDLYDIAGRHIKTYQGDRIGEGLPAGVYFLRLTGKDTAPARIVKVR